MFAERSAITHAVKLTIDVVAARVVVDTVAVAHVEPVLRAVPPDRVLHKPREGLWKPRVELPGLDLFGDDLK